ncbi:MAG: beta-ketoacyl synthase N-terminal-like domain-containing protein [Cyanobacteria bacterium P01_D01_bin.156]
MSDTLKTTNNATSDRVFRALKEARSQLEAIEQARNERVAVVGMAGRFPGADNLEEFWHMLVNGETGIRMLSEDELLAAGVPESTFKQPNYVPAYASFTDPTQFDARFFGYSPREAELIDPQHRVFLECAWAALEDAGYDSQQYDGAIGVYGGAALNSYVVNLHSNPAIRDSTDPVQAVVSNVMGLMPTRVSYQLDLRGPSCGIQTGCSTALVAIHTACQSLLSHECDMALAGGVTVSNATPQGYTYQPDSIAAPDGVCRAFDAKGQGTLFGNGVGLVVLKRLQAALRDGDYIYGVVKGSAINNDGADKVGLTAPSISGQAKVIQTALDQAGIAPNTISYVEGHGTGTPLGDPIEVAALNKVFNYPQSEEFRCALGSVKTNLGHLDAAAGAAGFIKTVLALKHKILPPSLNFEKPNPRIDFDQGPFFVNHERTDWVSETPKRAGVSSFGMGGTNAHVILEEAPVAEPNNKGDETESRPWQLVMLSAKTPTALKQMQHNLVDHLRAHPDLPIADVAYTLQVGRRSWQHRCVYLCQTTAEAIDLLSATESPLQLSGVADQDERSIIFMFSGQGSQHVNMALDLYESEPVFRATLDQCATILGDRFDLLAALYPRQKRKALSGQSDFQLPLTHTANAQPTLFVIEYALAQTYLSWGIQPHAVIGHSIGEYVAACVAGIFSLEDALTLVLKRGQLMQQCRPGSMLSVLQSADVVRPHLPANTEIAVINSPHTCVVSGPTNVIETLKTQLESQTIPCRLLETSHAFHSSLMESALADFDQALQQVSFNAPNIDIISNVSGTWLTDTEATNCEYWKQHLRQTVLFSQGITKLLQLSNPVFLELGPGHTLTKLVQQHISSERSSHSTAIQSLPHPRENKPDTVTLMTALSKLWLAGVSIPWGKFYQSEQRYRLPLPTYPFERESYWIPLEESRVTRVSEKSDELAKTTDMADWFYIPSWQRRPVTRPLPERTSECWVVFTDVPKHWQSLTNKVNKIIWVTPGTKFSVNGDRYTIHPQEKADYQRLVASLEKESPTQIVCGWGLSSDFNNEFQSLLWLIQALADTDLILSVLTCNIQSVTGGEALNLDEANVLGLCQVTPQEYPNVRCRHIDLGNIPVDLQGVIQELCLDYTLENRLIAYRHGKRWRQAYEQISLPEQTPALLKQGGTYLIAGDLVDGLGMVYAQALVKNLDAKLILLGRPGLPASGEWEKWLATHGANHSVSCLIRKLQSLGTVGETFLWFSGDLADTAWVQATVTQAMEKLGEITGVFHADVMGDQASCPINKLGESDYHRICRTKVQGIQVLQQVLADQLVGFYVLQSSLSTVVGGVGFAAYAGANSYLDTLAHQNNFTTQPWLSLNWDACQLNEAASSSNSILMASAMSGDEVWQTTQRALAQVHNPASCPQLVISPRNLKNRIINAFTPTQAAVAQESSSGSNMPAHARPALTAPYVAPRSDIEKTVAEAMGDLLGIDAVGVNDNFFELGGHSLLAIQAVTRLRQEFQVDLPMRAFLFGEPTVAGIAKIITENQVLLPDDTQSTIENLLDQIEEMNSEEVEQRL